MASTMITTAVRTARFPFMSLQLPPEAAYFITRLLVMPRSATPLFDRRACLTIGFAPLDGFALVVRLLALRQAQRNLHAAVLQIHAHGHERHPALNGLANQL